MNNNSPTEYIGIDQINLLNRFLEEDEPKNIFLVTGKSSFLTSGLSKKIKKILEGYNFVQFNDFETNPKYEDIKEGKDLFLKNNCDFIVAAGGGSAIDVAKCVNIYQSNPENFESIIADSSLIENKGVSLVAIPSTAGTGSEATHFAVIYKDNVKYSIAHPYLLPNCAIVDAQFTFDLPPYITACSGFDALCQAIESFWSVQASEISKGYARKAIIKIRENLLNSIRESNQKSRQQMAHAALLSGKAINITKTTAPHAISYPLTTDFGIPHGHAVALTLGYFFEINENFEDEIKVNDQRGASYVKNTMKELRTIFNWRSPEESREKWLELMTQAGLGISFKELKLEDLDIKDIASRVNIERLINNPIPITNSTLVKVLSFL